MFLKYCFILVQLTVLTNCKKLTELSCEELSKIFDIEQIIIEIPARWSDNFNVEKYKGDKLSRGGTYTGKVDPAVSTFWYPTNTVPDSQRLAGMGYYIDSEHFIAPREVMNNIFNSASIDKTRPIYQYRHDPNLLFSMAGRTQLDNVVSIDPSLNNSPMGLYRRLRSSSRTHPPDLKEDEIRPFETDPNNRGKNCQLQSYSTQPWAPGKLVDNNSRQWTSMNVVPGIKRDTSDYQLKITPNAGVSESEALKSGICGGTSDLGSPVICDGKITYLTSGAHSRASPNCTNRFYATHVADLIPSINRGIDVPSQAISFNRSIFYPFAKKYGNPE